MLHLKLFQKGFNYSQDGPGNRLVYHLVGCNLHCPWCSNPEGMIFGADVGFTAEVEKIVAEAISCKPMFFAGGVTFTGGEATMQPDALKSALEKLKAAGIDTCIETNGTYKNLPELFPLIDHLIIDIKHPDSAYHKELLGLCNEQIKENIKKAAEAHPDLLIRIPLIGNINTTDEAVEGFIEFLGTLPKDRFRLETLCYHEYGKDKWQKCGRVYTVKNAEITPEQRNIIENKFKNNGLNVVRT